MLTLQSKFYGTSNLIATDAERGLYVVPKNIRPTEWSEAPTGEEGVQLLKITDSMNQKKATKLIFEAIGVTGKSKIQKLKTYVVSEYEYQTYWEESHIQGFYFLHVNLNLK